MAKLKGILKNCKYICERLSLYCICNIVIGLFFAYRQAFSAVVLGYHRAIKIQPQGVFEKKKNHKISITREYLLFMSSMN